MSADQAKAFLRELAVNKVLREQLCSISSAEERMEIARESGFEFTVDEFCAARSELLEDELDAISGGSCCGSTCEEEDGYCTHAWE